MKVILSYPAECEKGEGRFVARALRRNGQEVACVNTAPDFKAPDRQEDAVAPFTADVPIDEVIERVGGGDLFLYVEPLGLVPTGMEASPIPTACIISDVHRNLKSRQTLAKLFDHVFLYQRDYLDHFDRHPPGSVHWSPWAVDLDDFKDRSLSRDLDVAFIGQLEHGRRMLRRGPSERTRVMEALSKEYRVNEQRCYLPAEIPGVYGRSKIVINLPIGGELNWRDFEALASGALLITRRLQSGLDALFTEDVHYVAFGDEEEFFTKVRYFLEHEDERARIAACGYAEAHAKHGWTHRMADLVEQVQSGPPNGAPIRRMRRSAALGVYSSVYERAGRIEALMQMASREGANSASRSLLLAMGLKSFFRRAVVGW